MVEARPVQKDRRKPRGQPLGLLLVKPEVEDDERDVSALRADRHDRIAQQRKILAVRTAGDQQPPAAHRQCCPLLSSSPRKRESRAGESHGQPWTPAFAGATMVLSVSPRSTEAPRRRRLT